MTCGFASSRPALSRRPCAIGAGTTRLRWTGASSRQGRAAATCRIQRMFSSCPHLLCWPLRHASAGVRPGSHRATPSAFAPPHPHAASAGVRSPSASGPPSRLTSFISELASHEVPEFGAQARPSTLGLEALASALAIARDNCVSVSGRRWRFLPPPPRQPAGVPSSETWPSLPVQRHPRGSNRVALKGRVIGGLSGRGGQDGRGAQSQAELNRPGIFSGLSCCFAGCCEPQASLSRAVLFMCFDTVGWTRGLCAVRETRDR